MPLSTCDVGLGVMRGRLLARSLVIGSSLELPVVVLPTSMMGGSTPSVAARHAGGIASIVSGSMEALIDCVSRIGVVAVVRYEEWKSVCESAIKREQSASQE